MVSGVCLNIQSMVALKINSDIHKGVCCSMIRVNGKKVGSSKSDLI